MTTVTLSVVEKAVVVSALNEQILSDRKAAEENPALAGYVERNIRFREGIIAKIITKLEVESEEPNGK